MKIIMFYVAIVTCILLCIVGTVVQVATKNAFGIALFFSSWGMVAGILFSHFATKSVETNFSRRIVRLLE
jgi:hypothetical protein